MKLYNEIKKGYDSNEYKEFNPELYLKKLKNNMFNLKKFKFNIKRWKNIPYATYMCIRFPFLYPRNRYTDRHYNCWKILNKINEIHKKYIKNVIIGEKNNINYTFKDKIIVYFLQFIHKILEIFHCLPTYTELDALYPGWKKTFGIQMCKELKKAIKDSKASKFRIMQLKEKWGVMELYPAYTTKDIMDVIHKYRNISYYTCVDCGKPAHYLSDGWICPYCEEHAPNGSKERRDFYGWTKSKYKVKGEDKQYSYEELYGEK